MCNIVNTHTKMTIPSEEGKVDSVRPSRPAATTFVNIFFLRNFEANMTKCFNFIVILKKTPTEYSFVFRVRNTVLSYF